MPRCKNDYKYYTGKEPSPKGLGYCASGDEEGKIRKGRDGYMYIKNKGKWIKYKDETGKSITSKIWYNVKDITNEEFKEKITEKLEKKLYKWWQKLGEGNIILIYENGKHKLITSSMKTSKAQDKDISKKWQEAENDDNVEAIVWSAQSSETIEFFIEYLIDTHSKKKLEAMVKMKDLPNYLLKNYEKYFDLYEFYGEKDFTLKRL